MLIEVWETGRGGNKAGQALKVAGVTGFRPWGFHSNRGTASANGGQWPASNVECR